MKGALAPDALCPKSRKPGQLPNWSRACKKVRNIPNIVFSQILGEGLIESKG
jgi:hypothetical protein